jgi:hypothetical protein
LDHFSKKFRDGCLRENKGRGKAGHHPETFLVFFLTNLNNLNAIKGNKTGPRNHKFNEK